MLPAQLDAAIAAVCPIAGVSLGTEADKSTWVIHFADHATDEQRAKAHEALVFFEYRKPAPTDELQEQIDFIRWVVGAELEAAPVLELSNDPPAEALMEAYPDENHAALKARILAEFASLRNMLIGNIPMTMEQLARLQALEHPKFQTWLQA
jgi:aminoglycoside phosphotransferase